MAEKVNLVPHATGPWLLRWRGHCYAVTPALARKLQSGGDEPVSLVRRLLAEQQTSGSSPGRNRFIWLRLPMLSAAVVNSLAGRLLGLASTLALTVLCCGGGAAYAIGFWLWPGTAGASATPVGNYLLGLGLFLVTAVWHELGHAAALKREGYPPGGIGVGLLLCFPVLYCDVTPAVVLPRAGKLRVDCAGVAFQIWLGGLLLLLATRLDASALHLASLAALAAVVWSFLPFLWVDGYWFLCDLLQRPDLEHPLTSREARRGVWRVRFLAGFLTAYRCAHGLFLLAICVWLPWRLLGWLPDVSGANGRLSVNGVLYSVGGLLGLALVGLIWYSTLRRLGQYARANRCDLANVLRPVPDRDDPPFHS
ncbi:MAG: hypothetical protein ABIF77_13010 [bacterium]